MKRRVDAIENNLRLPVLAPCVLNRKVQGVAAGRVILRHPRWGGVDGIADVGVDRRVIALHLPVGRHWRAAAVRQILRQPLRIDGKRAAGINELPLAVQLTTACGEMVIPGGKLIAPAGENGMRWQAVKVGNGLVLPVFTGEDGVKVRSVAAAGIANLHIKPR